MNLYKVEIKPKYSKHITYVHEAKNATSAKQIAANKYWADTGNDPEDTLKIAVATKIKS